MVKCPPRTHFTWLFLLFYSPCVNLFCSFLDNSLILHVLVNVFQWFVWFILDYHAFGVFSQLITWIRIPVSIRYWTRELWFSTLYLIQLYAIFICGFVIVCCGLTTLYLKIEVKWSGRIVDKEFCCTAVQLCILCHCSGPTNFISLYYLENSSFAFIIQALLSR